jgi:zinc protease
MKRSILLLIITIITFDTHAQNAQEIVDAYLKAIGGKEKLNALNSIKISGNINANGMEFPIVIVQKGKTKFKSYISFQGLDIVQPAATDGKVVWSTNIQTMQNELMSGEAADAIKREAKDFPEALFSYADNGYGIELGESIDVEDRACHMVVLVKPDQMVDGQEISGITKFLFDKESMLIVQKIQNNAMGEIKTHIGDYKEVKGLLFPFSLKTEINGNMVSSVKMDTYETNGKIDDVIFTMPN